MARTRRWLLCIGLLALLASAPAEAKAPKLALHLARPAPGHITLAVHTLTVRGRHRKAPRLVPQKLRSMPSSVRVLYARRTIHKRRSTTFATLLIAVNRAAPAAQSAGDDDTAPGHLISSKGAIKLSEAETVLLFMGGPVALTALFENDRRTEDAQERAMQATQADALRDAAAKQRAGALVNSVLDPNGDGKVDPGLDTGHYDDGHSFGWGIKTKLDQNELFRAMLAIRVDQYFAELEADGKTDLNGDGKIEPAPKPGEGGDGEQIDTQVGGPVFNGGGAP